uniref:Uncharacterized protein n=1 Tax=Arundo donax TaxID=35708 RepID=A0A0A9G6H2_ARUDO
MYHLALISVQAASKVFFFRKTCADSYSGRYTISPFIVRSS